MKLRCHPNLYPRLNTPQVAAVDPFVRRELLTPFRKLVRFFMRMLAAFMQSLAKKL